MVAVYAWTHTRHLSCEDEGAPLHAMELWSRWAGLAASAIALTAALIASARARGRRPSRLLALLCSTAFVAGLVGCVAPHSVAAGPAELVLVLATLAVLFWLLPALVILALMLVAGRWLAARADGAQRRLRLTQATALWTGFVLAPGFAGMGLISQNPICLG